MPTDFDLAGAARWLFASAYLRESAIDAGLDAEDSPVVHPGVDPAAFPPAPEREWEGHLLCLGRIDPRKGVATAIRALAELPGARLRCVGAGDEAHLAELRELADELGVAERVSFERVAREHVSDLLAESDALVFCVDWPEPFGLVPLEAMATGTPVIATATGGAAEYLEHEGNCLVVEPDDPAAVARAATRLGDDPALRARLRAGGFEAAAARTEAGFDAAVRQAIERAAR